jgi:hypothetical protein
MKDHEPDQGDNDRNKDTIVRDSISLESLNEPRSNGSRAVKRDGWSGSNLTDPIKIATEPMNNCNPKRTIKLAA